MNQELRLPLLAFCVAGIAALVWLVTRDTDINGLVGAVAVLSGICGFAGLAAAVVSGDKKD
ncbi:hypothetical protein ACFJIY_07675 [Pimelobacter simplex]|uniref:hypothetical protein n=1 Tax=Nocardioides simplex TaxID=2045 RepID=UPI003671F183